MNEMASGPCCFLMATRRSTTNVIASSQLASRHVPSERRIIGDVRRSGARAYWCAKRPLMQVWPRFEGPSIAGSIATTRPSRTWTSSAQPTPQYAHVVVTVWSTDSFVRNATSSSALVGHVDTHAPQETHALSLNELSAPATIFVCQPRPA